MEGILGLWRGLGPSLFRDVPFSGIYWMIYESLKAHNDVKVPTFWFSFIGGAVAGSVSLWIFKKQQIHTTMTMHLFFLFADSGILDCSIRCCQNASTNWIWRKSSIRRASGEIITETSYSWHFEENLRSKWNAGYFCWRNATYSENCTRMCHHDNIIWIRQSVFLSKKC